jgi:hypothetical protein
MYCMLASLETLTQKFNAYQIGKLFIVLNEIQSYGGSFKDADKMKTIITEEDRLAEPKGKDAFPVKCYENYVLLSNNDWTVRVDADDRRYACTRVNAKYYGDKAYFDRLGAVLTAETAKFMGFLLARDISEWNPRRIPTTTLRVEMKEMSLTAPMRYALDIAKNQTDIDVMEGLNEIRMLKQEFYAHFTIWCNNRNERFSGNDRGFYAEVKKVGIEVKPIRIDDKISRGVLVTIDALRSSFKSYLRDPNYAFQ